MKTIDTLANSEVTWLVYPFAKSGHRFSIGRAKAVFTTWDDVQTALREGIAPEPNEVLAEIERKTRSGKLAVYTT